MYSNVPSIVATILSLPMIFFKRYTRPRDRRWQGLQQGTHIVLLPLSALVVAIWVLFAIHIVIGKQMWTDWEDYQENYDKYGHNWFKKHGNSPRWPNLRWGGYEANATSVILKRAFALIIEAIHLPVTHAAVWTSHLHCTTTLSASIFMAIIWLASGLVDYIHEYFEVVTYHDGPEEKYSIAVKVMWGLKFSIVGLYVVYIGFAAIGVKRLAYVKRNGGFGIVEERDLAEVAETSRA